jgi:large subunit ribosomal protein L13
MNSMKSFLAKTGDTDKKWYLVDAEEQILGRLAVKIANILRGRNKATYTPHIDTGDFVVVINADKIVVSGKKEEQKEYMFYSGYFGNEKYIKLKDMRKKKPVFIIENAVKGMLPRNRLASQMLTKLKIYAGPNHPHESQQPITIES